MWKCKGQWTFYVLEATTDPGLYYFNHPLSPLGTAILKEGQYINSYQLGLHQGKYKALVESQTVTVIRDFDKDNYLSFNSGREETGLLGINIHRANLAGKTINVNQWSAGCQVFSDSGQFQKFHFILRKGRKILW